MADDEGRGLADTRYLIGRLHPYSKDINSERLLAALRELAKIPPKGNPLLLLYEHDGKPYFSLPSFRKHQRIDKPSESRIPAAPQRAAKSAESKQEKVEPVAAVPVQESVQHANSNGAEKVERKKTNQQLIIEAFAANRKVDLSNAAIQDRFFKANGGAASELDKLTDGKLDVALEAIADIARFLDVCVQKHRDTGGKEGISEWRHLGAINNNYLKWKGIKDRQVEEEERIHDEA
jgi:hypothetical protein